MKSEAVPGVGQMFMQNAGRCIQCFDCIFLIMSLFLALKIYFSKDSGT